jgi:ribosomal protein L11 methyltransferase
MRAVIARRRPLDQCRKAYAVEPQQLKFTEITVLTHPEACEGLTDALLGAGARGVAEERRPLHVRVTAYLPEDEQLEDRVRKVRERLAALERQGLRIGPGTIGLRTLEEKAWSEAWRDHFQTLNVAPGLVIVPSWEKHEAEEGEVVVVLEPGAAFGTGGHPTTRLCLRALVRHLRPGDRVIDVGCGSGILAIAAAVLGASHVLATDNDVAALPIAQANAKRNAVADRIRFLEADLLTGISGPWDLVVCNIVAEEVIRLAESLPSLLSRGARCIVSGFVGASIARVEDALSGAGLTMLETPGEEGWAACVAMRPDRGP